MAKKIYGVLGQRLKAERTRAGYTQEQLAEKAGVTGAFVAHIERATKHPTLETIERLAQALGVPVVSLFQGPPRADDRKDDPYLFQFARLVRGKTPRQKKALLQVVRAAASAQK